MTRFDRYVVIIFVFTWSAVAAALPAENSPSTTRDASCEERVLELRLIPELVDDVRSGLKTSTIRAGHVRELRPGPALFRVPGSEVTVPITIESVRFESRLISLDPRVLRAQGPFVAAILDAEGPAVAAEVIGEAMSRYYPGFTKDDDVTVVHFRVTGDE